MADTYDAIICGAGSLTALMTIWRSRDSEPGAETPILTSRQCSSPLRRMRLTSVF